MATSSMRAIGTPTCVAMRRFSRTVRFGKMPRPSGTVQMPRRARPSAESLVTTSPSKRTSPRARREGPGADVEHRGLAAPVRSEEGDHGSRSGTRRVTPCTTSIGP